ncbi:MAG: hypothetical protein KJ056_11415 [Acidimicrobiia bacterium]|nr:hypothetical protein [Acidimicrobiia bacterium]
MGFKEDADFARFVSMGAVGTAAVARNLRDQHGHAPIELERYAMANKVWQTKVKRLRLPDLACVRCGRRVESRAKSKLGIILSHSDTPGREWHAGGMRPDDWYAFLKADLSVFPAHAGSPTYFTTGALTASVGGAKRSAPKAASEGSEVTLTWPAWVPGRSGGFRGVDDEGRIVCEWEDGRTTRYWQWRNWPEPRYTYLDPGDSILGEESIVAGVVAAASELGCPGELWDLASDLDAPDAVDRYAAIKAAGATNRVDLAPRLARTTEHPEEDWRVRVEAYGSLARLQPEAWTDQLQELAADPEGAAEQHMEAVFVLSEIPTEEAATALATVASNRDLAVEVRSASAWGLGQGAAPSPHLLLPITVDDDPFVALHAITAIEDLPDDLAPTLIGWMAEPDERRAAVAAQLLQRHRKVAALLDAADTNAEARLWALRALGDLAPAVVRVLAGDRLTPDVIRILEPMWRGQSDWLRTEGADGLEALDVQKVRFDPTTLD